MRLSARLWNITIRRRGEYLWNNPPACDVATATSSHSDMKLSWLAGIVTNHTADLQQRAVSVGPAAAAAAAEVRLLSICSVVSSHNAVVIGSPLLLSVLDPFERCSRSFVFIFVRSKLDLGLA